jgi:outer membrane immunogenic protein
MLAGIGAASAADLPARTYTKAPALAPVVSYNWTGCYIGGNVGGGFSNIDQTQVGKVTGLVIPSSNFGSADGSDIVGGGQIGCDYQINQWVIGAQGMFDFGSIKSSHVLPAFPTFGSNDNTKDIFTATARIGYLVTPAALAYVKGGGAWTRVDSAIVGFGPPSFLSETASYDRSGWTIGGGVEWMFTPGWSVFVEYNYMDFGRSNVSYATAPGAVGAADIVSTRLNVSTALIGVNYKFNFGGGNAVTARY